jgi:hypothetical protein
MIDMRNDAEVSYMIHYIIMCTLKCKDTKKAAEI